MKLVRCDVDGGHLVVGDLYSRRILIGIDTAFHVQAGASGRARDQLHDGLMADQRFSPPVLCDEREQPVFDLIPARLDIDTCPGAVPD